jgi:DNA modification methylase
MNSRPTAATRTRRTAAAKLARAPREDNKLKPEDRGAHDWYRFVLSYPAHLVRAYLARFGLTSHHRVLDPFCGTGTTVVECKKMLVPCVGVEANPMAAFAGQVKIDWTPDPDELARDIQRVADAASKELVTQGITKADDSPPHRARRAAPRQVLRTLPPEAEKLLLANSISPLPLHKTLVLLDCIRTQGDERFRRHELLALAKAVVFDASNLHFGPEVGVGPPKADAPVVSLWLQEARAIAEDLRQLRGRAATEAVVHQADSRNLCNVLQPASIDAVITSPPYPNEKDYTRTTRLESVLLGFLRDKEELRALKRSLVRSNTRGVYKGDDDHLLVAEHQEIERIATAIEARRIELGKTSGFERLYARVTKLYFGGMARHLAELRGILRPGAQLAYVVGDQASYLRVMIRTGELLADIAQSLGYELINIDLFRTRLATPTREQLREEVVVLRWPGPARRTRRRGNGTGC